LAFSQKNSDMIKRNIFSTIAAIVIAAIGVTIYNYSNRERLFIDHAFVQLRGGGGTAPVAAIKLDSGDSASVILEHACCSGAGFDAVAIRTSDGQEFFAKKDYCGLEGFYFSLKNDAAKDLPHFKAFLSTQGYQKK